MSTAATPASTRVMNLAHFVTQARLRGPDDVALAGVFNMGGAAVTSYVSVMERAK